MRRIALVTEYVQVGLQALNSTDGSSALGRRQPDRGCPPRSAMLRLAVDRRSVGVERQTGDGQVAGRPGAH